MSAPGVPEPDTKDWTWVLRARCPQCGFDARELEREDIPELTRDYAAVLAAAARAAGGVERPVPQVWSPLEYACHVRDVCAVFVARLSRMLSEDDPVFADWDQDAAALDGEYWAQRPGLVAGQLIAAADTMADRLAAIDDGQWQRPSRRSNGSAFTVETFAAYFLHDLAHHAWDVTP
jgi:DinB family protein